MNLEILAAKFISTDVPKEGSLEDRLKIAMKAARNFFMTTDEQVRFKGAVGAVALGASKDEQERLIYEMRCLAGISAAMDGLPINLSEVVNNDDFEPIGLLRLWHESGKPQ